MSRQEIRQSLGRNILETAKEYVSGAAKLAALFLLPRVALNGYKIFRQPRQAEINKFETENERYAYIFLSKILATENIPLDFETWVFKSDTPTEDNSLRTIPDFSFQYRNLRVFIEIGGKRRGANESKIEQTKVIRAALEEPGENPQPFLYVQLYSSSIDKLRVIKTVKDLLIFLRTTTRNRHPIEHP